jgi:hypothetical protein
MAGRLRMPLNALTLTRRHFSSTNAAAYVKRLTLFKIPNESDIDKVLQQYEVVKATARKVSHCQELSSLLGPTGGRDHPYRLF